MAEKRKKNASEPSKRSPSSARQLSELARDETQLLADMILHSPIGTAVCGRDGRILFTNRAMANIFGTRIGDFADITEWATAIFPDPAYRKEVLAAWRENVQKKKPPDREYLATRRDGKQRWVHFHMVHAPDARIIITAQDITKRKEAESALRRTQFAIDHADYPMFWVDKQARIVQTNDAMCTALGYSRKELLTRTVHDVAPEYSKKTWASHWKKTKRRKHTIIETVHKRKDGTIFPVEVHINYQEFEGLEHHCNFVHDITERKQAEQTLRETNEELLSSHRYLKESEGRFRQLASAAFEAIVIHDNGVLLMANDQFFKMFGYKPDELLNTQVIPRIVAPEARAFMKKQIKEGRVGPYESVGVRKGGDKFPMEIRVRVIQQHGRKVRVGAIVDITDRKKVQEELLRLAAAVNSAAESIVITDVGGAIQYVNPYFEKMTGYKRKEVLGKNPKILSSGKQNEKFYEDIWKRILAGKVWRGHFTNRKKDGSLFEEHAVISPVKDQTGKIANFVAVKRDVTHEHHLESQIRRSQKMAAIGQLAHKIAHDFTNVLVTIQGNAELIKMDTLNIPKVGQYLSDILGATNRISSLTAELLAFAHPARPMLRAVRLDRSLLGVEEILRRTIPENVKLTFKASKEKCRVNVDPTQLEQAVMHLAINALEAMPDGGELKIETGPARLTAAESARLQAGVSKRDRHEGGFGVVSVTDTGRGMTHETESHIFEPFYTTKGGKQNPGLGLTTVYSIIEGHNGHITVGSEPGKGSTFRIYLPMAE